MEATLEKSWVKVLQADIFKETMEIDKREKIIPSSPEGAQLKEMVIKKRRARRSDLIWARDETARIGMVVMPACAD